MMGDKTAVRTGEDRPEVTYPHQFLDSSVDWRKVGGVTYVKNQGSCGSCWTFATCAAMEHAHWRATNELVNLAESQFVDCDTDKNGGCNGGDVQFAYDYAKSNPVMLLEDYPYVPKDEACKYKVAEGKVLVTTYQNVKVESVEQLKAALNIGAVHVSVQADKPVFHAYTGGVITDVDCGTSHNHAITAVGYGSDTINGETVEYYIVKNSWGPGWGEDGYVRIAAVAGKGICGVQTNPTQP
jgi:C1A family cysteine protease